MQEQVSKPLIAAADVCQEEYPRAFFDGVISHTINEYGRRRAPTKESVFNHQIGLSGEIAVASCLGVRANWDIYEGYEGDDGYDFECRGNRVEVKSVTYENDPELRVARDQVDTADHFVLTRVTPMRMVEIIGYAERDQVRKRGDTSPYDNKLRLTPRLLNPFPREGPVTIEQIRATQSL